MRVNSNLMSPPGFDPKPNMPLRKPNGSTIVEKKPISSSKLRIIKFHILIFSRMPGLSTSKRSWPKIVPMLGQSFRRRPNIETYLNERPVLSCKPDNWKRAPRLRCSARHCRLKEITPSLVNTLLVMHTVSATRHRASPRAITCQSDVKALGYYHIR